ARTALSRRWERAADRYSFFFQAEDGIRALYVTGVQTCALPILYSLGQFREYLRNCPSEYTVPTSSVAVTPDIVICGMYDARDRRSEERRVGKEGRCRRGRAPVRQRAMEPRRHRYLTMTAVVESV